MTNGNDCSNVIGDVLWCEIALIEINGTASEMNYNHSQRHNRSDPVNVTSSLKIENHSQASWYSERASP